MNPQSRIISKIIAPAVRLWLRSQVEQVKDLQVTLEAGDHQILAGQIRRVSVWAQQAVYRGLHLSQVHLAGNNIHLNLAQVLRGQPLQPLEVIPVEVELLLQAADLNASLQAPLLATAISDFLRSLLQAGGLTEAISPAMQLHLQQISIDPGQFTIRAKLVPVHGGPISLILKSGLKLESVHVLRLDQPRWFSDGELSLPDLDGFKLDLGSEVTIQELSLETGQLVCCGQLVVQPAS